MPWREADHPRDPDGQFRDRWAHTLANYLVPGDSYRPGRNLSNGDGLDWSSLFNASEESLGEGDDPALSEIYHAQGFDGKPTVVSREQMDRLIKEDWTELWRGMSSEDPGRMAEWSEQMRSGGHFPGRGVLGNGTYATRSRDEALSYTRMDEARWRMGMVEGENGQHMLAYFDRTDPDASPIPSRDPILAMKRYPGLVRMALRPDARVIKWDELPDPPPRSEGRDRREILSDKGRLAAALGYDAFWYRDHFVVLNRTAVAIQEAL